MSEQTQQDCFIGAVGCGVAATILGIIIISMMDQMSKAWLITLIVLLSILITAMIALVIYGANEYPLGHSCSEGDKYDADCNLIITAFILSGFSMMLNIRLCYSTAPYALMRFKIPENLFSVFVRRVATSMEIWCLPTILVADAMEYGAKGAVTTDSGNYFNYSGDNKGNTQQVKNNKKTLKQWTIVYPTVASQWLNFLTYVILLFVYVPGDQGHLTAYYWVIAASGLVFGLNNPLTFAIDDAYLPIYIAGENCFPATTSMIHYLSSLIFGNRRKYNSDFIMVYIDLVVAIILSIASAVVWTIAYLGTHATAGNPAFSGVTQDPSVSSLRTGGRLTGTGGDKVKAEAAPLFHIKGTGTLNDIKTNTGCHYIAAIMLVLLGLGMVYSIYPGIAPGMIVPFYLIDKIEMTLLILTIVPAMYVALARRGLLGGAGFTDPISPTCHWTWLKCYHKDTTTSSHNKGDYVYYPDTTNRPPWEADFKTLCTTPGYQGPHPGWPWHMFDLIILIMLLLAGIFIYSLHYRGSLGSVG